jgi:hypothetical protein
MSQYNFERRYDIGMMRMIRRKRYRNDLARTVAVKLSRVGNHGNKNTSMIATEKPTIKLRSIPFTTL